MKKLSIAIGSILLLLFFSLLYEITSFYAAGPLDKTVTLVFPPNTHFTDIVDIMAKNNVIRQPFFFKVLLFATGTSSHVKAGEYDFPPQISESEVAGMLRQGKTVIHHLKIPEGLMTSEVLKIIKDEDALAGELTLDVKEGELLPETYNFSRDDKRNDIVVRMRHAMQKTLDEAWEGRESNLPFTTPLQALTLASIVEKETGLATERSRVAGVYINRLRKDMLLQADPTTIYAVTHGKYRLDRALTYADLASNSPYNTYKSPGLPPGPIANPGKASILATLHPMQTDELYFVATGTGGHNFARTEAEQAENVKKYLEVKRAQAAQPQGSR